MKKSNDALQQPQFWYIPAHYFKKRKKGFFIFAALISLILIHIILTSVKITVVEEENYCEQQHVDLEPCSSYVTEECILANYSFQHDWSGWSVDSDEYTSPYLQITNLENVKGDFYVQFAFYDDSVYPYEDYRNYIYRDLQEQELILWEKAHMYSEKVKITLGPKESKIVQIVTKKKRPGAKYWALYKITPPLLEICRQVRHYKDKNVTLPIPKLKKRYVPVKKSLWNILMTVLMYTEAQNGEEE